ncbi:MAG TPA: glycosyltransferase family 61 protein [Cytophagales bacterium]|nr:glycosyltransferase family 61 protein [Cytophagales bacterium]
MLIFNQSFISSIRHRLGVVYHRWKKRYYTPFKHDILSMIGYDFYYKAKRKLYENFEKAFRFNSIYKPKGIYKTSKEYYKSTQNEQVEIYEIYKDHISTLPVSEDFYKAISAYAKPKLTVKTDYVVIKIPNGRVYTNNMGSVAIISHDNKLLGDVSFQYKKGKIIDPKENIIFSQNYFTPPLRLPGTVFSMLSGGGAINNYGHWLMDALPRLHLLKESGLFESVDWFLVPSLQYDYQIDTLKLLGIPFNKIIEGDKLRHVQGDHLIATTAPRGNNPIIPNWVFEYLRDGFLNCVEKSENLPSLVYISRKDSKFRNVLNEVELVKLITPYGFQNVTLSDLSFVEKVNLFANADVILGASGAGLTNIFFCKKGSMLIELFSEGFVLTDYIDIAHKAEMAHSFIISESLSQVKSKKQGQKDHMIVDLKKVRSVLDKILAPSSKSRSLYK